MADGSKIEWTDATWNPVTGCTKVTPGCDHCYAETLAERFRGTPGHPYEQGFDLRLWPERLDQPLRWTRPRRVFVNSMSDLFHQGITDDYIAQVWAVMSMATNHTFQLLTKRHGRLHALLHDPMFKLAVNAHRMQRGVSVLPDSRQEDGTYAWPLRNVWVGVSVEDQKRALLRVPALMDTPAAVRWLSCEPLLGAVDLTGITNGDVLLDALTGTWTVDGTEHSHRTPPLDWVVVGGESGPGARPMHPQWARQLRDQCLDAGVPFTFKQWGAWQQTDRAQATHLLHSGYAHDPEGHGTLVTRESATMDHPYGAGSGRDQDLVDRGHAGWVRVRRVGKKAAGRQLDGRTWDQHPQLAAV